VLVYARRWRQKADWLKRFSCPQCGESLKCFLQNPQHYQLTQGKGIPDSVKKCPSCSLDFDAEFPGLESDERKPA
jgi:ribosomal protein S27AE